MTAVVYLLDSLNHIETRKKKNRENAAVALESLAIINLGRTFYITVLLFIFHNNFIRLHSPTFYNIYNAACLFCRNRLRASQF